MKHHNTIPEAVLGEYSEKGFSYQEEGDHTLALKYRDKVIGRYSQTAVTVKTLRDDCQTYLESIGGE